MAQPHITAHHVAPYVLGGVSSVHILVRMWRLSRLPVSDAPFHLFLLKHTDVVLVLSGGPVLIWHLAKNHHNDGLTGNPSTNGSHMVEVPRIAHQLRQVFTALLLGLGLIKRKITAGKLAEIPELVQRLKNVVIHGINAVNELDPQQDINKLERVREV